MGARESLSALLELRINERQGKIRPSLFKNLFILFFKVIVEMNTQGS